MFLLMYNLFYIMVSCRLCGCGILCIDKSGLVAVDEVDAVYDIESLNACNAGPVGSNQDVADDESSTQNLSIITLQLFGRLKG